MSYEAPKVIIELLNLDYYTEDDYIDFEAYGKFSSKEETAHTLHCWTGDKNYHGEEFRIFGTKGDGSEVAIWLKNNNVDILEQPVVLLESEGQAYTISTNFSDFLWCLESGFYGEVYTSSVTDFVHKHATTEKRTYDEITNEANEKYDFREYIWAKVVY